MASANEDGKLDHKTGSIYLLGSAHDAQAKVNILSARDYAVLDSDKSCEEGEGAGVVQLLTKLWSLIQLQGPMSE